MIDYRVGEEVLYDGEIYVISAKSKQAPYSYRLLASRADGARFTWAEEGRLNKIDSYLRPRDDTTDY